MSNVQNKSGWPSIKLDEICANITDGKHGDCEDQPGSGYYFLSCKDIYDGKIHYDRARQITEFDYIETNRRTKLTAGDVLITNSGSIGRMAIVQDSEITNRSTFQKSVAILKPNVRYILSRFMLYAIQADLPRLTSFASGTAQKNLLLRDLRSFEIPLPPLPIQRRIASILSAYDDLIENNQRRIAILEAMARGVYREWFVHYRYPGHEGVPLVDSPLGPIPQWWEVRKLGEIVSNKRRTTKANAEFDDQLYVPIECIPSKSLALIDAKPTEEAQSSLQLFDQGDILFGAMRPYFHKVALAPFNGITRTTCFVLTPIRPVWHAFATLTVFEESTINYATTHSQGATIPYATWEGSLSEMPVIWPTEEIMQQFEKNVSPLLLKISQYFFTHKNLRRTRDLLLPRLLSGQIAVGEVE
jgi:type I restriction enzyme S subunit